MPSLVNEIAISEVSMRLFLLLYMSLCVSLLNAAPQNTSVQSEATCSERMTQLLKRIRKRLLCM